jgi:2-methylisocitrate lyase-like PEP mutase family enzyme
MEQRTQALRRLLADEAFVFLPVAYDALGARLVEKLGFKAVYTGGSAIGNACNWLPFTDKRYTINDK